MILVNSSNTWHRHNGRTVSSETRYLQFVSRYFWLDLWDLMLRPFGCPINLVKPHSRFESHVQINVIHLLTVLLITSLFKKPPSLHKVTIKSEQNYSTKVHNILAQKCTTFWHISAQRFSKKMIINIFSKRCSITKRSLNWNFAL